MDIAQHRAGCQPAPRLQRLATHLHDLGPRAVFEFIVEMSTVYGPEVTERLEAYGRIDPALLRAVGADRFTGSPIRRVA